MWIGFCVPFGEALQTLNTVVVDSQSLQCLVFAATVTLLDYPPMSRDEKLLGSQVSNGRICSHHYEYPRVESERISAAIWISKGRGRKNKKKAACVVDRFWPNEFYSSFEWKERGGGNYPLKISPNRQYIDPISTFPHLLVGVDTHRKNPIEVRRVHSIVHSIVHSRNISRTNK